jgi:SAM-dependent methyltransferase
VTAEPGSLRLDDPTRVGEQYATEANLEARRSVYTKTEGPDPREVLFRAIAEVEPRSVLEVGGGPGELAERVARDLRADVVMVDISERMVELARARGVDARVGDVQELPFADEAFDVAVAAWMLFHVPDLDRGLAELARVLRPGGRLVAVTNAEEHSRELRGLAGSSSWVRVFTRENGAEILGRRFELVDRRDADGWAIIDDAQTVHAWVRSLDPGRDPELPTFELPLRVRRATSVFVCRKP